MSRDELRSQFYAFLGDRTIQPVGYEWEHDRLRVLVDRLMDLPALRALLDSTRQLERVRAIVDRVAADPANATDELWVYSIRKALGGDQ